MGVQINGSEGNVIASKGTYSGNVTIGGTLTYEDVTNIDSVGLVTARTGIEIGARPGVAASISVDGNMIVSGISTFGGDVQVPDKIIHSGDTNTAIRFPAADTITAETGGSERLRIDSTGSLFACGTTLTEADLNWGHDTYQRPHIFSGITGGSPADGAIVSASAAENPSDARIGAFIFGCKTSSTTGVSNSGLKAFIEGATNTNVSDAWKTGGYIKFSTRADNAASPSERLRITSDGHVLIGTTVTTNHQRLGNALAVVGTSAYSGASFTQYNSTAAHKTLLDFNRSKGGSIGDMTTLANNDGIAHLVFRGSDGTNFVDSAGIRCDVDKVPSSNSVKGKISIETGNTGTAYETIVATSDGHVQIPRQPYFVARAGTSRNDVGTQVLVFDTAVRNNGSHYDTSTSKFTAPIAGAYVFGGTPAYQETNDTLSIFIRVNGSNIYEIERVVAGSMNQHSAFGFSTLLYLNATEEVDLYSTGQCHQNGSYSHWFGYLLG